MFSNKERSGSSGSYYLSDSPTQRAVLPRKKRGYSGFARVEDDKRFSTKSSNPLFANKKSGQTASEKSLHNEENSFSLPPVRKHNRWSINTKEKDIEKEKKKIGHRIGKKAQNFVGKFSTTKNASRNPSSIQVGEEYDEEDIGDEDREALKARMENMKPRDKSWAMKHPQRISIGLLAVALLWSTSFSVVDWFYTYVVFPRAVYDDINKKTTAFETDVVEVEKNLYTECASLKVGICQALYASERSIEVNRTKEGVNENNEKLAIYETARLMSRNFLEQALNILENGVGEKKLESGELRTFYIGREEGCPRIENWIAGDAAAGNANASIEEYYSSVTDEIEAMKEAYNNKDSYDGQFMEEKAEVIQQLRKDSVDTLESAADDITANIERSFEELKNCRIGTVSDDGNDPQCAGLDAGVAEAAGDLYNEFSNFAVAGQTKFDKMVQDLRRFKSKVDNIIDKVQFAKLLFRIPGKIGLPTEVIDVNVNTGELKDAVDDALEGAYEKAEGVKDDTVQDFEDEVEATKNNLNKVYEEQKVDSDLRYDPPPLNLDAERAWNESVLELRQNFSDALQGFGSGTELPEYISSVDIITVYPNISENIVSELPPINLSFFAYSEGIFQNIAANFYLAKKIAEYTDILYRIITTVSLFNKYWNLSAIGKPPADVRLETAVGEAAGLKEDKYLKLANKLTSPWVAAVVAFIFVILIILSFLGLYSPFFIAYKHGCVNHDADDIAAGLSPGTLVYNNMFSTSFEYTVQEGDDILRTELNKLNVLVETDCEHSFQESVQLYENQLNQFNDIRSDFVDTVKFRDEILGCLNLQALEDRLSAEDNITGPLTKPEFNTQMIGIEDAFYKCENIESCDDIVCDDPPVRLYQQKNHELACETEWYFHANFLSVILSVLTFALVNYSRYNFMNALVQLNWKHLNPYDFTFLASCTLDGKHVDPEVVKDGIKTMKEHIMKRLNQRLAEWQKEGYSVMVHALAMNIPWIVACAVLAEGAYSASN
eukprot:augustus_masked-scaffold_62-processed-gene-0.6-mRNA-1 protein AED:1.00 eAED:1.00 QI:0/-1/0/0/-1/1/1/0/1002